MLAFEREQKKAPERGATKEQKKDVEREQRKVAERYPMTEQTAARRVP